MNTSSPKSFAYRRELQNIWFQQIPQKCLLLFVFVWYYLAKMHNRSFEKKSTESRNQTKILPLTQSFISK